MKVAIVHDWLTNLGGAERVVLALSELYPDAPIYTSVYDRKALPQFKNKDVRTTWLQRMPIFRFKHKIWAPLRPFAFSSLNLEDYDLVISSSSAEAKNVKVPNGVHISYCHTPIRYYWIKSDDYLNNPGLGKIGNFIVPKIAPVLFPVLKRIDYKAAQEVDYFIANSSAVQKRIKDVYHRDSEVIFPPVETDRFKKLPKKKKEGFLIVGRQVPYKRFDLAVAACTELDLPLTVVGSGPEHKKLKAMAGKSVKFVVNPTDKQILKYFASAEAFIFPGEEDFGIVPVEAMAAGLPVIAYGKGGSRDYVIPNVTGKFFRNQSVSSLVIALKRFKASDYESKKIKKKAEEFNKERFKLEISEFVSKVRQEK